MLRRHMLSLILSLLLLAGCGPAQVGTGGLADRECPTIVVENNAFDDIILYHVPQNMRMGDVGGLTRRSFRACYLLDKDPVFFIRSLGGRFSLLISGVSRMDENTRLIIRVENNPRLSSIIGPQEA